MSLSDEAEGPTWRKDLKFLWFQGNKVQEAVKELKDYLQNTNIPIDLRKVDEIFGKKLSGGEK
jgi:hypothetical protein